jgi:TPR repeat protein
MYVLGQEVPQNFAEAFRWYRKAAEQGHASAQVMLGGLYEVGNGTVQDYAQAVRWYRKAAEQGDSQAQSELGVMYDEGHGVPQDFVEAHMWLNLAASRAHGDQQKYYAELREALAKKMTPQQIAEAQRRAREWKPKIAQESKIPPSKTPTRK